VRFLTSDGELYDIDWRDIEEAFERDPEGRTVPGPNRDELLLTAEDCVMLYAGDRILTSQDAGRIRNSAEAGRLTKSVSDLSASYIHMHVNRFLRSNHRCSRSRAV